MHDDLFFVFNSLLMKMIIRLHGKYGKFIKHLKTLPTIVGHSENYCASL